MLQNGSLAERKSFIRLLFLAGTSLIVFYAALLLFQTAFLFAGIGLTSCATLLSIVSSLVYYWVIGFRVYYLNVRSLSAGFLTVLAIGLLTGLIAANFIDLSWDGRDYQQKAIRHLVDGWNPIYTVLQPEDVYYNAWLNHYPKGPWIAAASVVLLTGNMEAGKVVNWLLIVAVFLIALSYFLAKPRLHAWQAALLALFLAANPVSVYQSLSYYIDGQVSSVLILLALLLLLCVEGSDLGRLIPLAAVLVVGVNVKFTGTTYIALLLVVFLLAILYMRRNFLSSSARLWIAALSGVLLGLLVVGYNPYLINTFRYGHPFYPIYGSSAFNKQFVMQNQLPVDFVSRGALEKLMRSIFSPSNDMVGASSGPIKFPLSVRSSEIAAFARPDVRLSGWGPLFGALVIYSLLSLVFLVIVTRAIGLAASGLIGLVLATSLLNSEAWWARYSPQLWLIPVIVLGVLWYVKDKRAFIMGILLAVLMFANIFLVSGAYFAWNFVNTRETRATLAALRQSGEEVLLYYGPLDAAGRHLQEYGIPYQLVETRQELPCPRELELMVYYSPLDCTPETP